MGDNYIMPGIYSKQKKEEDLACILHKLKDSGKLTNKIIMDFTVEKWEKILCGKGIDKGRINCACCIVSDLYYHELGTVDRCFSCLIRNETNMTGCEYTPYIKWLYHQNLAHPTIRDRKINCSFCEVIAKEELQFLVKIREKSGNNQFQISKICGRI